ncbi:MAG: alpha/beta hydrolase [Ilumatobacteraceae bacterium]
MSDDLFPDFSTERIDGVHGVRIFCRVGGDGPPVVLVHGFPQTHAIWHQVAPALAAEHTVVVVDLRGYGRSDAPPDDTAHITYSKREMGADVRSVMRELGFARFAVVGHDRGGRVAYRMALDHPKVVERVAVLDILPTLEYWDRLDRRFGLNIYHWMFLAQPAPFPERLIGGDPHYYCDHTLASWTHDHTLDPFVPAALAEYRAMFDEPARIAAMCADYRAGATTDVDHDIEDRDAGRRIEVPLLDAYGFTGITPTRTHGDVWRRWARDVTSTTIPCGHFVAEEDPAATTRALERFLA